MFQSYIVYGKECSAFKLVNIFAKKINGEINVNVNASLDSINKKFGRWRGDVIYREKSWQYIIYPFECSHVELREFRWFCTSKVTSSQMTSENGNDNNCSHKIVSVLFLYRSHIERFRESRKCSNCVAICTNLVVSFCSCCCRRQHF